MSHIEGEGTLVRIFIGEADRLGGRALYEAIVLAAREMGLGGATVLRGIAGFGADSVFHTTRLLRMSQDLPVVVEVVDSEERLTRLLPEVDHMMSEGMVTMEKVRVLRYTPNGQSKLQP